MGEPDEPGRETYAAKRSPVRGEGQNGVGGTGRNVTTARPAAASRRPAGGPARPRCRTGQGNRRGGGPRAGRGSGRAANLPERARRVCRQRNRGQLAASTRWAGAGVGRGA